MVTVNFTSIERLDGYIHAILLHVLDIDARSIYPRIITIVGPRYQISNEARVMSLASGLTFDKHDLEVWISVRQPSSNNAACGATTTNASQKDVERGTLNGVLTRKQ